MQDIRFFQIFTYVLAGLVGFTIFIYILASVVADNTQRDWRTSDPSQRAAVDERVEPLGQVVLKGEEKVVLKPDASASLSFLPPAATAGHDDAGGHGDEETMAEGDAAAAEDAGEAGEANGESADAAVAEATEETKAGADDATETTAADAEDAAAEETGNAGDASTVAMTDGESGDEDAETTGGDGGDASATDMAEESPAEAAGGATAALAGIDGQAIYNQGCNVCHAQGVAGAPKLGDPAAWEARVTKGRDVLYEHAINGFNAMPAKGGFTYLSDEEVMAAVNYMVEQL